MLWDPVCLDVLLFAIETFPDRPRILLLATLTVCFLLQSIDYQSARNNRALSSRSRSSTLGRTTSRAEGEKLSASDDVRSVRFIEALQARLSRFAQSTTEALQRVSMSRKDVPQHLESVQACIASGTDCLKYVAMDEAEAGEVCHSACTELLEQIKRRSLTFDALNAN